MTHLKTLETRRLPQQRYRWKLELVKGLYDHGYNAEDVRQLFRFIDWLMMLPEDLDKKFEDEIAKFEGERKMEYVSGIERRAIQRGLQQGLQQGLQRERDLVLRQLKRQLGKVSKQTEKDIRTLSIEKIEELGEALLDFQKASDLQTWLSKASKKTGRK